MAVPAQEPGDDSVLVGAVQAGDLEAFSELFRRHYPAVQRACARRLACPLEAEEIAQAAFVRALERIGQCRGERPFGGWVQIIARHLCVDAMRAKARVVPHEAPVSEDRSDGTEPDRSLLDREQRAEVRRALASLPPRQRQAVTARAEGTGPGQIADDLGLTVGAVDSLILRGRRRLALAYQRVAGEGGATATATSATAAASLLAAFSIGSTRLLGGVAAAAEAGRDLVRPVASGVAGAVMAVAVVVTGSGPAAAPEPASHPPAVVVGVPLPGPGGTAGGAVSGGAGSGASPSGPALSTQPGAAAIGAQAAATVPQPGSAPTGSPTAAPSTAGPTSDGPGSSSAGAAPLPGDLASSIVDPVVDAVDATLPAVNETVSNTTDAVADLADDTVDAVTGLVPK